MVKSDKKVNFIIRFQTTPLSSFTNVKDHTPFLNRSNVVYKVTCPGCGAEYIGKTDRTLFERTSEHAWADKASCVREHIHECENTFTSANSSTTSSISSESIASMIMRFPKLMTFFERDCTSKRRSGSTRKSWIRTATGMFCFTKKHCISVEGKDF